MRVIWRGKMGYRRGDMVTSHGRRWLIDRMQRDANGVFTTMYTLRAGELTDPLCTVVEVAKDAVRHAGSLIEIGRDGIVRVLES